jgi:laminin alpha 3/5
VRTADENDVTVEGESPGTFSVLDLDSRTAKFYVGGVPESAGVRLLVNQRSHGSSLFDVFQLSSLMTNMRFIGGIESVEFGGIPIGLWNFHKGASNHGCKARDDLADSGAEGFRFDGSGYVILEKGRFIPTKSSLLQLSFKTFNPNGLLFLMGNGSDYYSLELRDGRVVYQYDLGSGAAVLETSNGRTFNDGQWHRVDANRKYKDGLLKVDDQVEAQGVSLGFMKELSTENHMYLGGYKGTHNYKYMKYAWIVSE